MSFFGKYRGTVTDNQDVMMLGRLQVSVPAVLPSGSQNWAMPCVPYAGSGVGLFALPPVGANVWVEFEGGDPERPIWSGGFWGVGEVPATPALPGMKVLKTDTISMQLSDLPGVGGFKLEVTSPTGTLSLTMDATGISLSNGTFSVAISQTGVAINTDGLVVM